MSYEKEPTAGGVVLYIGGVGGLVQILVSWKLTIFETKTLIGTY